MSLYANTISSVNILNVDNDPLLYQYLEFVLTKINGGG